MHISSKLPVPARWHLVAALGLAVLCACSGVPREDRASVAAGERTGHQKLDGWGPQSPPSGFPRFVDHSVGQEEISMQAMGLVGVPYRWGGNTPAAGFDCSGLVRYVVERAASIDLPRTTADMSREGVSITPDAVAPGDLIFFNTTGRAHSHVGVYVGDYRFVNAPSTGGTVRIDYVTNPYWAKRFDGIRRVAGRGAAPVIDSPIAPPAPPSIMPARALAAAPDTGVRTAPAATAYAPTAPQPMPAATAYAPAPTPATPYAPPPAATVPPAPTAAIASTTPGGADPIAAAIAHAEQGNGAARGSAPATTQTNSAEDDPIARIVTRGY
ncbi:MAG: C40 family peptidase [Janthinobacterium lividum]